MTTTAREDHSSQRATDPLALKLNEELGPLPEAAAWLARRSDWQTGHWEALKGSEPPHWASVADPLYTHAAIVAAVAAERERCARLCEQRIDSALGYVLGPDCATLIRGPNA